MKKHKIKRIIALILVFCMSFPMNVNAESIYKDSHEHVDYCDCCHDDCCHDDCDEHKVNTEVHCEISSHFKVTLPKDITLDGKSKKADYNVWVEGDIAGDEKIFAVPETAFNLKQTNKENIAATVSQDKTSWRVDEFDIIANGEVEAPISAGHWDGQFCFNINISEDDFKLELAETLQALDKTTKKITFSYEKNINLTKKMLMTTKNASDEPELIEEKKTLNLYSNGNDAVIIAAKPGYEYYNNMLADLKKFESIEEITTNGLIKVLLPKCPKKGSMKFIDYTETETKIISNFEYNQFDNIEIIGYEGAFDNASHSVTVNAPTGNILYSLDNENFTSEKPEFIEPGVHIVYIKVSATDYADYYGQAKVVIKALPFENIEITGYTGTYDTKPHSITVDAPTGNISYSLDNENFTNEKPEFVNAGVYTVYVKVSQLGYEDYYGQENVVINKATREDFDLLTSDMTYTDKLQDLISTAAHDLIYKINDGEWTNVFPKGKDAGIYNITAKYRADSNYEDLEKSVKATIKKKDISELNAVLFDREYNGHPLEPTIQITFADRMLERNKDFTATYSDNTNVGTATVVIKGINNFEGEITKTFEITKAAPKLTLSATSGETCTKSTLGFTITSASAPIEDIDVSVTTSAGGTLGSLGKPTLTQAGNTVTVTPKLATTATVTLSIPESENYEPVSATYTAKFKSCTSYKIEGGSKKSSADCTNNGYNYYKCSKCGKDTTSTYVSQKALGHNTLKSGTKYLKTAATCYSYGVYYDQCSRCGTQLTTTHTAGSLAAHSWVNRGHWVGVDNIGTYVELDLGDYCNYWKTCGGFKNTGTRTGIDGYCDWEICDCPQSAFTWRIVRVEGSYVRVRAECTSCGTPREALVY